MCCQHGDRGICGMWNTRTSSSSACGACFRRRWPGVSSGTSCTWRNKPRRGCCRWRPGNVWGGVVPLPANKGGRTAGPGLHGGGLLWRFVLFRRAIWSFLSTAPMYLKQEAKLEHPGAEHSCKMV